MKPRATKREMYLWHYVLHLPPKNVYKSSLVYMRVRTIWMMATTTAYLECGIPLARIWYLRLIASDEANGIVAT